MVATAPIDEARDPGLMPGRTAADTNFVFDYFRLSADNRRLFGVGDSYSGKTPRNLISKMRASMLHVFPQLDDLEIAPVWGGFVDVSMNRARSRF